MPSQKSTALDDRQKLALVLAEMKVRNIPIPPALLNPGERTWPIDSDGYFYKADGKRYKLTYTDAEGNLKVAEEKKNFIWTTTRFAALCGGRGSGKSAAGAQRALQKIKAGQPGSVINPDFENFRYSTWPEFREWIPWDMVVPSQRNRRSPVWQPRQPFVMVFMNGARVYCKGLKNPDSARGPNLNWLWYDEGSRDETGLAWQIALASVRIGPNPQAFVTFTPKGMEHWTYKFFVDQEIPQEIKDILPDGIILTEHYNTTIDENKENLDPGFYASMLKTYPTGWQRDQELYGKFVEEGGVLGDPAWFLGHYLPEPLPLPQVKKRIRYWDFAATEKDAKNPDPDSTVGTLFSWDGEEKYFIDNQVSGQWKWENIKTIVCEVAKMDGPFIDIYIEQEPGAGGKNQVVEIAGLPELAGYKVKPHLPEGDKIQRANTWFSDAAQGRFYMVKDTWNKPFIEQLSSFPRARHDDKIDGVSGARQVINPIKQWKKMSFLSLGKKSLDELRARKKLEEDLKKATESDAPGVKLL